jgi:Lhr-like helicase
MREGAAGRLQDTTRVVYVSPLKALSNDIQRNLEAPLAGISAELIRLGMHARGGARAGSHRRHARSPSALRCGALRLTSW